MGKNVIWQLVESRITTLRTVWCFYRNVEKDRHKPAKRSLLFPAICKQMLTFLPKTSLPQNNKLDYLARAMKLMQTLYKDTEADENQDNLSGLVSHGRMYCTGKGWCFFVYTLETHKFVMLEIES